MRRSVHAARTLVAAVVLAGSAGLVACSSPGTTNPPSGATEGQHVQPTSRGGAGPAASVTPTAQVAASVPPNSTSPATPPTMPPPCATSALQVSVSVSSGAAGGSSYYPIVVTNASAASCTLYGYPGVSFVTGTGGSQIGIPATENPARPRQLITLAPGRAAHAELQVVDAQNYPPADCGMVTARWLKVYPPNQTAPLYARFTAQACTKARAILTVETVQPGTNGA
jgi:hypothetical protein